MAHTSPRRRSPIGLRLLLAALLASCSGGGGSGGCSGFGEIPTGRFEGAKTDNAVNLELSSEGLAYLNGDWQSLVELFAPGREVTIPFGCKRLEVPLVGALFLANQGTPGCGDESCGRMDDVCDSRDAPANVTARITGFALEPRAPNGVYARVGFAITTPRIFFNNSCLKCDFRYDSTSNQSAVNIVDATVLLKVDQRWDKRLTFDVAQIDGIDVCGSGAEAASGRCIETADLNITGQNFCGDVVCGFANFVKDALVPYLSPLILDVVKTMANRQAQATCEEDSDCPVVAGASASCAGGVCVDDENGAAVPRQLGIEGRFSPGALLGAYGVSPEAALDMAFSAGSSVRIDEGIMVGTRAGLQAVELGACAIPAAPPPNPAVPQPDFAASAGPDAGYHVGLAISQPFLNMAVHHAQQSGALCLGISGGTVGALNTSMVKTFLPSLGKLVTRDGLDAPMLVALRPLRSPRIEVGEGTYDPVTKKPISPLVTLIMEQLQIDFYALVDERYVRLFSLGADVKLPLSLIFNGCSSVLPALGDLRQVITNVTATRSEMLAEDPTLLADLIPAVLGLAEPAIAQLLAPVAMPELAGYRLRVDAFKGITPAGAPGQFHHLGIFASLIAPNVACGVAAPQLSAELIEGRIPSIEAMQLTGRGLPWPVAVVRVGTPGSTAAAEYAWRVDEGMWTTFAPASDGRLEVSHPSFLLQGTHRIELRARDASQPHGLSTPVVVPFTVDFAPPEITLTPERRENRLHVAARDNVTPVEGLEFAYRVGSTEAPFGEFGPARPVDLAAVTTAGGFAVRVRDAAGNVGEAVWRDSEIHRPAALGRNVGGAQDASTEATGCTAGGALPMTAGLLALAAWLRRRRP